MRLILTSMVMLILGVVSPVSADEVDEVLVGDFGNGTLTAGEARLVELVEAGGDDRTRLALGLVRFFGAGEHFIRAAHRFDMGRPLMTGTSVMAMPMLAVVPPNLAPEIATLADVDAMAQRLIDDMTAVESALSAITDDDVELRVDLAALRFDLNGDGMAGERETGVSVWNAVFRAGRVRSEQESFVLVLDRADVEWLRAYCRVVCGFGELWLAHDESELFARTGHLLFPRTQTEYGFLRQSAWLDDFTGFDLTDAIAMIHLINFEVDEPDRIESARGHFGAAVERSRAMWGFALAETDDNREWLPNPDQTPVFRTMKITEGNVEMWLELLDEVGDVLDGEKLVRFWRGDGSRGINVRRVFAEQKRFDLVLWIQGSEAAPYLEKGEFTRDELWRDFGRAFNGRPFRYIFYIN